MIVQIEVALKIWSGTLKNCQQAMAHVNNETSQDNNNIMLNGEIKLSPNYLEQQQRLLSLKSSTPSITGIIEARQANIEKRAERIIEFKKATPKL